MKIGYIDTSFLLSILFQDEQYEKSAVIWNSLDLKYSSLLLQIEAAVNVYKYYSRNKKSAPQYSQKEKELTELLSNIHKKTVDYEIALEIKNSTILKRPRSLDSIHLATAHILNKVAEEKILMCSYDKEIVKVGKELGMEVLLHEPE